jgi:hypothetical protein
MRIVQVLAFGVFAALLVACSAWAVVWFATPPPPPDAIQAAPKSAIATIHLNSDPQGTDATTSLGWSCRTPCSIELLVDRPFTVTFTRSGFAPSIIPVKVEAPKPGASDAKFSPDPVFAALQPVTTPKANAAPARIATSRPAPPRDVHDASLSDGPVSRGWKYLQQKTQDWLGRLIPGDSR